jgi:hypothetical protein
MRILCAYSGIEFTVEHFPAVLNSREVCHPIFYLPQHKLLSYIPKWHSGELTSTDSYLLYLALFNSTELIEWRVPALKLDKTVAIVANNMPALVSIVSKINVIKHPNFVLPRFVISPETKTLENSSYWIQSWIDQYNEFLEGYKTRSLEEKIVRREEALERLINNSNRTVESYATILADWASMAGSFPTSTTEIQGKQIPLVDYWKTIIKACAKNESIFTVPKNDLEELVEYCEQNIPHGSIYAHTLMQFLRDGLRKQTNYLGIGDIDIADVSYRILSPESSIEDANKQSLIDSAPKEEPRESQYPTKLAYLKAKLKYQMAQSYKTQAPETGGDSDVPNL